MLAHAVERIVYAGVAVDESRPTQATVSRQHSDFVTTKGCSDTPSLPHPFDTRQREEARGRDAVV